MHSKLFSDEIRERERRRRRKDLLWSIASFTAHIVIFGAVLLMTPVKSLVFEKEKKKANPAADLSADRIEQIADSLSQARVNELLKQLEALQTVLHNMDLMKEKLQEDYDAFAADSSENLKETLARALDEVEKAQKDATAAQGPVIGKVEKMVAEEKLDLRDEARSKWLNTAAGELMTRDGESVADAQARAGNTLDRIQVQAEFGGYRKTAEATEKFRGAQMEAASMQNQAQKEASEIGAKLAEMRRRTLELEHHEKWLAGERERLAKIEADRKALRDELDQARKALKEAAGKGSGT